MRASALTDKGVDNVSMNQISKTLDIGMATLYRNFEDKPALCYQLIENDFAALFADMHAVLDDSGKESSEKFEALLEAFLTLKKPITICYDVWRVIRNAPRSSSSLLTRSYLRFYAVLGESDDATWNTFKTDMLLNSLTTNMYQFQLEERGLTDAQLKRYLLKMFE